MQDHARRFAALGYVARSNVHPRERPDRFLRAVWASALSGAGPVGALATGAARYPSAPAVVDNRGSVTYRQLGGRSATLTAGLRAAGAGPGTVVGLLARNTRFFVEALVGAAGTGADVVLLNTGFASAELAAVVDAERIDILLHDEDLSSLAEQSGARLRLAEDATDRLGPQRGGRTWLPAHRSGRIVILTSGTTGRAKGAARRAGPGALEGAAAVLQRIPLRVRDTQVVAAPMFHAWGLLHLLLGLSRSATTVVQPHFDASATLEAVEAHRARVLVVVPVMLRRMLALGPERLVTFDLSSVAVIAASGSALGADLAASVLRRFGPVLYNVYGSTEVALATVATPDDLSWAPATAGRVAFGSRVEVVDEAGQPLPVGTTGRIFVGSAMGFEGYTSGGDKERLRGLVASGDVGHLDARGRLFVDGREDDMIVSGGENVFPAEVEDVLSLHPGIADVAVTGVDDDEFGQALAAFVVRRPGAALSVDDVRDHVRRSLARFKVPRRVVFVDDLPRTATGKVLKRWLA
jgi:fatty-acyl-CoA synthase